MNFKELTKKERRLVLSVMHKVYHAMGWSGTLEDELSFDYDPGACQERFEAMLNAIKHYKNQAKKFDELKHLLK